MRRLIVSAATCLLVAAFTPVARAETSSAPTCRGTVIDPTGPRPVSPYVENHCSCPSEGITLVSVDPGPNGEIIVLFYFGCMPPTA